MLKGKGEIMTQKEKRELFEKIQKRINTKEFEEEAVAKLKDYIDKTFTDIKAINFGDPVKVVFEPEVSDRPISDDLLNLINKVKTI